MSGIVNRSNAANSSVQTRYSMAAFSLVELLIAMTLGLLLLAGMISVFAGNKRSSDLNSAMADIQENARFALNTLAKDVRMAGFQGCVDINSGPANLLAATLPTADFHKTAAMGSVVGAGSLWQPEPPLGFDPSNHEALPGTHALTLQFGSPDTFPLTQQISVGSVPDASGPIIIDTTPGSNDTDFNLSAGDYAMISNCVTADIFRASSVAEGSNTATINHTAPENYSGALTLAYNGGPGTDNETKFMRFLSSVYYVGDTGLMNEQGDSITALYQQSLPYGDPVNNPPTELVRGIENMRIAFGVRVGNQGLSYVTPGDPLYNPSAVESIRIGLLMNSYDRISQTEDSNTYVLAGQPIVAKESAAGDGFDVHEKDKRFRLAFNTTVKIRNRRD